MPWKSYIKQGVSRESASRRERSTLKNIVQWNSNWTLTTKLVMVKIIGDPDKNVSSKAVEMNALLDSRENEKTAFWWLWTTLSMSFAMKGSGSKQMQQRLGKGMGSRKLLLFKMEDMASFYAKRIIQLRRKNHWYGREATARKCLEQGREISSSAQVRRQLIPCNRRRGGYRFE